MPTRPPPDTTALDALGLNRLHVFDLADLPAEIALPANARAEFRQMLLIGHAGRQLWSAVQAENPNGPDPIDAFTRRHVGDWLARQHPGGRQTFLYPGDHPVGLQALGKLAGWHHTSPFMIGIDAHWGSWFAYRAAVLCDSDFAPTPATHRASPCPSCATQACLAACPADALAGSQFNLARCSAWRLSEHSPCAEGCLARVACPVGSEHRYEPAQIRHSYRISLAWLKAASDREK